MSQRQVRRLLQPQLWHPVGDDDEDIVLSDALFKKGPLNRYQTLLSGEVDDADEQVGHSDEENESTTTKKKTKRKKKRKKGAAAGNTVLPDVDKVGTDDDNDFPLTQLASQSPSVVTNDAANIRLKRKTKVLRVERRFLNSETEKLTLATKNPQLAHKLSHQMSKKRGHDRRPAACALLTGSIRYHSVSPIPISMELQRKDGDIMFFTLVHKAEYQRMQQQLLQALNSADPGQLIALLSLNPSHPELLMQVSHLVGREDAAMASQLIQRAISSYESVFHPRFLLSLAYSRMDYRRNENRPLFVSLFRQTCALKSQGLNRTSLEVSKLLLSLDPDGDPLSVHLIIDFLALSANQTDFLISLYDDLRQRGRPDMLPNFRFSVALAHFKKASSQKQVDGDAMSRADTLIQDALLLFPQMLFLLLDKCSVEPDADVRQSGLFLAPPVPKALHLLLTLYAERNAVLWSDDRESIFWLEKNVRSLISDYRQKEAIITANVETISRHYTNSVPRTLLRHVFLSEFKDSTSLISADFSGQQVYAFDPFPPNDAISSYEIVSNKTECNGNRSVLGLFLQSWMPAFNPDAPVPQSPDANRLSSSVASLMQAMSGLLLTANQQDSD